MNLKVIVYPVPEDEGGGCWVEVPALPGCATEGASWDDLKRDVREAIES